MARGQFNGMCGSEHGRCGDSGTGAKKVSPTEIRVLDVRAG